MSSKTIACAALVSTALCAGARGQTVYRLNPPSTYEVGCHDPCDCLLRQDPAAGTFVLTFTGSDPLFDHYAVSDVQWAAGGRDIRGSGTYRIGGEVAVLQQMELDLTADGRTTHFDSGLVGTEGRIFPDMAVYVDNQVGQECFYSAAFIDAAPLRRHCTADFNNDGDIGTDEDIEAFFACLAGDCCPTCGDSDFNADGDDGTDADIESFFRVLAGGPC
jgi:hypothetical protein